MEEPTLGFISLPHPEAPPTKPKCSLLNTTEHLVCVRNYF